MHCSPPHHARVAAAQAELGAEARGYTATKAPARGVRSANEVPRPFVDIRPSHKTLLFLQWHQIQGRVSESHKIRLGVMGGASGPVSPLAQAACTCSPSPELSGTCRWARATSTPSPLSCLRGRPPRSLSSAPPRHPVSTSRSARGVPTSCAAACHGGISAQQRCIASLD